MPPTIVEAADIILDLTIDASTKFLDSFFSIVAWFESKYTSYHLAKTTITTSVTESEHILPADDNPVEDKISPLDANQKLGQHVWVAISLGLISLVFFYLYLPRIVKSWNDGTLVPRVKSFLRNSSNNWNRDLESLYCIAVIFGLKSQFCRDLGDQVIMRLKDIRVEEKWNNVGKWWRRKQQEAKEKSKQKLEEAEELLKRQQEAEERQRRLEAEERRKRQEADDRRRQHEARERKKEAQRRMNGDEDSCSICLEKKKTVAFLPCGHLVCCTTCADSVMCSSAANCPVCRHPIKSSATIYV